MKTQAFKAYIVQTRYKSFEINNKFTHGMQYVCEVKLQEIKQGKSKKAYHIGTLFINEEQFNNKYFSKGDKILVKDTAKWKSKLVELKAYQAENIKKCDATMLKKDENGKTYATHTFYSYTLQLTPNDYELIEKVEECCYIQVGKAKFYMPECEIDETQYCFFFDKDTFDKLEEYNMKTTDINCYLHGQRKWKKIVEIQSAFDDDSGQYFANLIIKE